jgi:hypothetical protein
MGLPLPSARSAQVDLGRESASASSEGFLCLRIFFWRRCCVVRASPFFAPAACWCALTARSHLCDGGSSLDLVRRLPVSGALRGHGPTPRPLPSGRSGWRCFARGQTPPVDRARALRCGLSTGWPPPRCGGLWRDGPFSLAVEAEAHVSDPTARRSIFLVPYLKAITFENRP